MKHIWLTFDKNKIISMYYLYFSLLFCVFKDFQNKKLKTINKESLNECKYN